MQRGGRGEGASVPWKALPNPLPTGTPPNSSIDEISFLVTAFYILTHIWKQPRCLLRRMKRCLGIHPYSGILHGSQMTALRVQAPTLWPHKQWDSAVGELSETCPSLQPTNSPGTPLEPATFLPAACHEVLRGLWVGCVAGREGGQLLFESCPGDPQALPHTLWWSSCSH